MQQLSPPQPIPYPDNPILKKMYRLPIVLYRLGLGPIIGKHILILTTIGRKTGKIRRTPIEYFRHDGQFFVMSGFGENAHWYKNLQAHPRAGLNISGKRLCTIARKPQTKAEWDGVIVFLKASPVTHLSEPNLAAQLDDPEAREAIKNWPIFTFEPTNEPCPPAVEADLIWTWPLIMLIAALSILMNWLFRQNR
jgi:deazaflavin-dependent oxidoreductase (nitroreductase family)